MISASLGKKFRQVLTAKGGSGKGYVFSATGLPSWLTLATTGEPAGEVLLSGTAPSKAGTFTFSVKVTDSAGGFVIEPYTITVQ